MKKVLKWTGFVVAGIAVLVLLTASWVYLASEHELDRRYDVAASRPLVIPSDPAELEEGRRLAHITGCTHCHAENLGGAVPLDIPNVVRFVAPNVTAVLPGYSDAELETLLRKGVRRDGTSVFFMPAAMLRHLDDRDVGRIIAWLRTVPRVEGMTEQTEVRAIGRLIIAKGDFKSAAQYVLDTPPAAATAADETASRGRYLVMAGCTECHGQDLNGEELAKAPPLSVARNYSAEDFSKLMHDGVALGGRETELMSPTARSRFASFTAEETAAIYEFLQSRRDL
ncbi:MAG TPA: c-type cytochrome [Steroidobacteraceae bacterium]|nr:c-type cytochrome [Steroidobacteraceae bacterium]